METAKFSTKHITNEVIANNTAITDFLTMGRRAQEYYISMADASIGLPRNERRELNRILKGDFDCTKAEAFQFLNFIKQQVINA